MKHLTTFFMILAMAIPAKSQWQYHQDCKCPEDPTAGIAKTNRPDTMYMFTPSHRIVLCGFKDTTYNELLYSEFILCVCGCNSSMGYWDPAQTCRLRFKKDTLVIENIKKLPVGADRQNIPIVWSREKVFFYLEYAKKTFSLNATLRTYSKEEIQATLQEYKLTNPDRVQELMSRLFIATISGNRTARKHLRDFESTHGKLDKEGTEQYQDLLLMLSQWDRQNKTPGKWRLNVSLASADL